MSLHLINEAGLSLGEGAIVESFRGEAFVVVGWYCRGGASSGRVIVVPEGTPASEWKSPAVQHSYYPSVFNLRIVDRDWPCRCKLHRLDEVEADGKYPCDRPTPFSHYAVRYPSIRE